MFVSTNERDPRYFDLYEIATEGYAGRSFTGTQRGRTLGADLA